MSHHTESHATQMNACCVTCINDACIRLLAVLQCVAVRCSVFQCVAACCMSRINDAGIRLLVVLQRRVVWCNVFQCVPACSSLLLVTD